MMPNGRLSFLVWLAILPVVAQAQTAPSTQAIPSPRPAIDLVGEFAVAYGGDPVAELYYTNGSTTTMSAGQGGTLAAGLGIRPSRTSPLRLRTTVGYKFVLNPSTNSNARLTRIPVEAVASYNVTPDVWLGGGYVLHTAIKLNGDGFMPDLAFDPAHGATVEAGWRWIAARYTQISYTDSFGGSYNASNVGVTLRLDYPIR